MTGAIDAVQTIINIFDPCALDCMVPICQQYNVAVIARCVLDEGGLTGFLKEDTTFDDVDFRKSYFNEVPRSLYLSHVDSLKSFIPGHASSLAALAMKFVLHHPGITTALTSMHVVNHARENISAASESPLSDDVFYQLYTRHRWVNNLYHSKYWSGVNDLDKANQTQTPTKQ
jgi:aryl-alcohol dehydrogenase-like predicted oxidoreductase